MRSRVADARWRARSAIGDSAIFVAVSIDFFFLSFHFHYCRADSLFFAISFSLLIISFSFRQTFRRRHAFHYFRCFSSLSMP
jgi:hypothetical protein